MLTKEQKQNVFKSMLDKFETEEMKLYFMDMVAEIPDVIFSMPSSTSGKYHNKTQCKTYGQVYHTYMFHAILNYRLDLNGNQEKFKSPIQRDCMRCVPVFHDAIKVGWKENSKYTVHEHPILAHDWVLETKVEHDIDDKLKKVIANMCASHSGQYTTTKRSKVVLPEPSNDMEFFIHECDILSSRNNIDMIISEELQTILKENVALAPPSLKEYQMPFGKHKGILLKEVPIGYLKWLITQELDEPLHTLIMKVLKGEVEEANENDE